MKKCSIDGCEKPFLALSFCGMHYRRFKIHGDLFRERRKAPLCKVEGCGVKNDCHGYCGKHYMRWLRYGNPHYVLSKEDQAKINRITRPNLGKLQPHSYKKFHGKHEHRLVMEQKLGRKILKTEIVHHIDGNKHNNHPNNLELLTQPEHIKAHHKEMILIRKYRKSQSKHLPKIIPVTEVAKWTD